MARFCCYMILCMFLVYAITSSVVAQEYYLQQIIHSIREGESGGELDITVQREGTGDGSVRLRMSPLGSNPATAEDYDTSDIQLDFTGSETSESTAIQIIDDSQYEGDGETFLITLTVIDGSPGNVRAGSDLAQVTILDNDSLFSIDESESDLQVSESAGTATFTITRVGYLTSPATVSFSTDEISNADEGDDYVRVNNYLVSFGTDVDTQTVDVTIIDDDQMEVVERFDVFLSNPTNGEVGSPSRSEVAITNDDGMYSFTQTSYAVSESARSVEVCVERTQENTVEQRNVLLTTTNTGDNTATADLDYTPLTSSTGQLTFAAGDNLECLDIGIVGDNLVESSEFFSVQLAEVDGELGSISTAIVTITDDDAEFHFQTSTAQVSENAGTLTIAVVRESYLQTTGTVRVTSANGAASSPDDFAAVNSVETFSTSTSGISTSTVTITIVSDNIEEGNEVFYLDLVSPVGGTIGSPSQMTITIVDDDDGIVTQAPGDGTGLSDSAIGGIIAAAVLGGLGLLVLSICLCCLMRCPCCPRLFAGRGEKRPLEYVQQPVIIGQRAVQPIPIIEATPVVQPTLAVVDVPVVSVNEVMPLEQYNAAFQY